MAITLWPNLCWSKGFDVFLGNVESMLGSNDINHKSNTDIRSAIVDFLKDEGCSEYSLA